MFKNEYRISKGKKELKTEDLSSRSHAGAWEPGGIQEPGKNFVIRRSLFDILRFKNKLKFQHITNVRDGLSE